MKKLLISLLAVMMAVCALFAFAGCDFDHITIFTPNGKLEVEIIGGGNPPPSNNNNNEEVEIDFSDMTDSEGLAYELNADGTAYTVTGIGTFTGTALVIPSAHSEAADAAELPVTAIGACAFDTCENLTSVVIPDTITAMGRGAFGPDWPSGCLSLQAVNYLGDAAGWCSIEFGNAYANPVFYAKHLYINGELLTGLNLPSGLETIQAYAFYNCAHLEGSLVIPETVTKIGTMAFYNCSGFTGNLVIPASVNKIGGHAFGECSGLTGVELPERESITFDIYAFSGCSGLTSVTLGKGIGTISQGLFFECSQLTSIVIPEGVTKIEQSFFYGCTQLKTLTIPASVTWMDVDLNDNEGTVNLTDVYYNGTEAQWNAIEKVNQCLIWTEGELIPTLHYGE